MASSSDHDDPTVERRPAEDVPNPVWFKPIMLGLMVIGLIWVLVFYLSSSTLPVPGIGGWNLVIGFGIAFIGFLMTTRWR